MLTLSDAPEPLPPGALPLPPAAAKRKRGGVVRGTAIVLEARPPGPGKALLHLGAKPCCA